MKEIELQYMTGGTSSTSGNVESTMVFSVPETFDELTLRQFIDWQDVSSDAELNGLDRSIKMVAALTQKEPSEIGVLSKDAFSQLSDVIAPILRKGFKNQDKEDIKGTSEFVIGDKTFIWEPDYFKDNIGNIARMEQLLGGKDLVTHFHYVLACCAHEEGEEFDLDFLDEKAELFLDGLTMGSLHKALFFSANEGWSFQMFLKDFSEGMVLEEALLQRLAFLRDGECMTFDAQSLLADSSEQGSKSQI